MKAKSKWLAIFLVLGLVLAACGDGGGDDETTTSEAAAPDTTEAESPDTTEGETTDTTEGEMMEIATDVGVDLEAGTINVGMLSDLTGPGSYLHADHAVATIRDVTRSRSVCESSVTFTRCDCAIAPMRSSRAFRVVFAASAKGSKC